MSSPLTITYRFEFPNGRKIDHSVILERETGRLVPQKSGPWPEWTKLAHFQCVHCPLSQSEHSHCPVAQNLSVVAGDFADSLSYEKVKVEVVACERVYLREGPLQDGLFGLMGLIMATSACPYMDFLRPMARFHLPFSSFEETVVRSIAFYLLAQHFVAREGGVPDFALTGLVEKYSALDEVNVGITDRLRSFARRDAQANSMINLDSMSKLLTSQIAGGLAEFRSLFAR